MGWSNKYKRSIDCNNPKGFSQKAHCAGRKKRENVMSSKLEELVGKPITEEQFDEAAGKKDACYHKVKARYDVWPSAYASGALVKCRKVGAANWGNKSKKESVKEAMSPKVKRMMMNAINDEAAMDDFLKKYGKSIPKSQDRNIVRYRDDIRDAEMGYGDAEVSKKYLMKIFKKYIKEGLGDLKALPKDLKKSIKKKREEGLGDRMSKKLKKLKGVNLKKKKIKLKAKSGRGKISHFGMEGFASDAQRRAAFASGYKAKGKKKKKEGIEEARGTCWVGYQQLGMKKKGGKMVPNCVKEITELYYEVDGKGYGYTFEYINDGKLNEAEYQGRKVKLGKIMQGDAKKFKVYVKNPKGNVVKVNFGQGGKAKGGTMRIRKSNPKARANFRARHNCDNPGPRHKARYWACRTW